MAGNGDRRRLTRGAIAYDKYGDVNTPFVGLRVENKAFVQKKDISSGEVADIKRKTGA